MAEPRKPTDLQAGQELQEDLLLLIQAPHGTTIDIPVEQYQEQISQQQPSGESQDNKLLSQSNREGGKGQGSYQNSGYQSQYSSGGSSGGNQGPWIPQVSSFSGKGGGKGKDKKGEGGKGNGKHGSGQASYKGKDDR